MDPVRGPSAVCPLSEHRDYLLAIANAKLPNERRTAGASDFVQDAYANACGSLERFDGRSARAWLATILRNRIHNHHRDRGRRPAHVDLPAAAAAAVATPSEDLAARERTELLRAALGRLGESDRELIQGRVFDGLSFAALAERLGVSEKVATARYGLALDALRRLVGEVT